MMASSSHCSTALRTLLLRPAAFIGGGSLLLWSILTAFCAIWVEAILQEEPSLRGLVHAGVMVLFAWICLEDDDNADHHNSSIGLAFAGFGLTFLSLLPLSLCSFHTTDASSAFTTTEMFPMIVSAVFLIASSIRVLFPVLQRIITSAAASPTPTAPTTTIVTSMFLFLLGSGLSLYETWISAHSDIEQRKIHWTMFVLDAMANVFHRAFIGSLLVGGTEAAAATTTSGAHQVAPQFNKSNSSSNSSELSNQYRAYFCMVATNIGVSWILCSTKTTNNDNENHRYIIVSSGIMVLLSGMLQLSPTLWFIRKHILGRQWKWQYPTLTELIESYLSFLRRLPKNATKHQSSSSPFNEFEGYATCFVCFTWYAASLFYYGIVLEGGGEMIRYGFDGCLVRAVHVAAVYAAVVAIFPYLLLVVDDDNYCNNKKSSISVLGYNALVKTFVATPAMVDISICIWILFFGTGISTAVAAALYGRIIGATLQASSFIFLKRVKGNDITAAASGEAVATVGTDAMAIKEAFDGNNAVDNQTTPFISRAGDWQHQQQQQSPPSPGPRPTQKGQDQLLLDERIAKLTTTTVVVMDGFSLLSWSLYWSAHVYHSCVVESHFSNSSDNNDVVVEIQLSKIFHFQVITLGFYTSVLLQRNYLAIPWKVSMLFVTLEVAGIIACSSTSFTDLRMDQGAILVSSLVVMVDGFRQSISSSRHLPEQRKQQEQTQQQDDTNTRIESKWSSAVAVLFPS